MTAVKDEDIMIKVKDGRVQMLAILFERYHVKLYNFFMRLTSDRGQSEDLTQEVFFRMLKYRATYRGDGKFTTWMFRIGRNAHIDHLKKFKKEIPLGNQWEEEPAGEPSPDRQTQAEQEAMFIRKALSRLSPTKKEVILLSRFQGMKYGEISRVMGCSISSVKVQVHRAMKDLKNIYAGLKGGMV